MERQGSSFSSFHAYRRAITETPRRLLIRGASVSTASIELTRVRARSGSTLQKNLQWFDLIGFGIGGMVGAGVFITTGRAARLYAGPAIILSYAIAGLSALLSAFCYTEFAVDMPVTGGAFSYLKVTFGEFAAFLTGANLLMEYVLSNAAVARSFTAYLGTAIGVSAEHKWRVYVSSLPEGFNQIDLIAVAVILIISVCICYSTKDSSALNMILTAIHIIFIAFVIIIGFTKGDSYNLTHSADPNKPEGFMPYGISGVFNGAAVVYLSYIGYDAVSTMAEEVRHPTKDIPIGVSGSVIIVTVLYCLMAASMSMLVPYDAIDIEAPFSTAFNGGRSHCWGWVSKLIGGGASFGILTSLVVAMLGQARYLCVIGRSNVLPSWFAQVHPTTCTPVNASAFLGILTASIALFTDLNILLNLVSIGTLFVFYMVANAVIYRRYVNIGTTNPWPTRAFLLGLSFTAMIFTLLWKFCPPGKPKAFMLGACILCALALLQTFHFAVPQACPPQFWEVPMMPWIPSISIFLHVFLLGSLDGPSYVRFGFFSLLVVVVYLFYSVHASFDAEGDGCVNQKDGVVLVKRYSEESDDDDDDLQQVIFSVHNTTGFDVEGIDGCIYPKDSGEVKKYSKESNLGGGNFQV